MDGAHDSAIGSDDCDAATATSSVDALDEEDTTADGSDGTLIDIEGIEVDPENTCISPDVTVLGQGPAEPAYHAPRCLRELTTGTRYIARRGSAAVPEGFERCPIASVVDWPICGQCECGGPSSAEFELTFACGVDAETLSPACGIAPEGPIPTMDQCWYNLHTTAVANVYGVSYPPPWVECGDAPPGTLASWFADAKAAECPDGETE